MKYRSVIFFCSAFLGFLGLTHTLFAEDAPPPQTSNQERSAKSLVFYIDDFRADFYPETDWIRENLIRSAIYDAVRRNKAFVMKDLVYNQTLPESATDAVSVRILEWRQNHSGFYQFSGTADYYDATGTKHNLGVISGTQSNLGVFNSFDVRDSFVEVVENAFRQALRKIEKLPTEEV